MTRRYENYTKGHSECRWEVRASLIKQIVPKIHVSRVGRISDMIVEEILTDISQSGSWLSQEAYGAREHTSDNQWNRLVSDIRKAWLKS